MTTPKKGSIFTIIDSLQILFAGIAFSLFVVAWITGWDIVIDVFKPDLLKLLSYVRVSFVVAGLVLAGLSGPSVIKLGKFVLEMIEIYKRGSKELSEIKKEKENQE